MPASLEVTYYNSYWGKKLPGLASQNYTAAAPEWSSAYVAVSGGLNKPQIDTYASGDDPWENQWYIEEARIKGGYNNTSTDLGVNAGIAVLVAGSLGMIVPVNAGIGAYHFLVASILVSYNLDYDSGLFFATILHTSQIICLAVLGVISSIILFFKIKSGNG